MGGDQDRSQLPPGVPPEAPSPLLAAEARFRARMDAAWCQGEAAAEAAAADCWAEADALETAWRDRLAARPRPRRPTPSSKKCAPWSPGATTSRSI